MCHNQIKDSNLDNDWLQKIRRVVSPIYTLFKTLVPSPRIMESYTVLGVLTEKKSSSNLKVIYQSLTNSVNGTEGDAVGEHLHEVFALFQATAELRIQGHRAWKTRHPNYEQADRNLNS